MEVAASILAFIFFIPFLPLVGAIMGAYALIKGCKQPYLAKLAIIAGLLITILQVVVFLNLEASSDDILDYNIPDVEAPEPINSMYKDGDYENILKTDFHPAGFEEAAVFSYYRGLANMQTGNYSNLDFENSILWLEMQDSVTQAKYVEFYYAKSIAEYRDGNYEEALGSIERALQIRPAFRSFRMFRAEILEKLGRTGEALSEYGTLADQAASVETRLMFNNNDFNFEDRMYTEEFTIRLVPINNYPYPLNLSDLCILLESKFLAQCEVDDVYNIKYAKENGQANAEQLIQFLELKYADTWPDSVVVGITESDMTSGQANYLFSLVPVGRQGSGVGIVSIYRFAHSLPLTFKRDEVLNRRLGIQLVSAVGQMLGFSRPTSSQCPLAYPNSIKDFSKKSSALCEGTAMQRDSFLKSYNMVEIPDERIIEYERVYKKYGFD